MNAFRQRSDKGGHDIDQIGTRRPFRVKVVGDLGDDCRANHRSVRGAADRARLAGDLMPKPTATGSGEWARMRSTACVTSASAAEAVPVMPVIET